MMVSTVQKIATSQIKFEQGMGCGRYYVVSKETGERLGEVLTTSRFGYKYWKVCGRKTLYTTRNEAASSLI